ncbi:hypothetical protein BN2497_2853 [Janthinobacterium sp. CG23_2]|nr:hypothetical protein BN2497_2853 [Janthinobacterium sp. CG23_2]CUU27824.1 hypothetical protein BN3177_2853 [Janthinobacterium sp. CG23_2]
MPPAPANDFLASRDHRFGIAARLRENRFSPNVAFPQHKLSGRLRPAG